MTNTTELTTNDNSSADYIESKFRDFTYDMFMFNFSNELDEITQFSQWINVLKANGLYSFEAAHLSAQKPIVPILRNGNQQIDILNFSSYNYLGFGYHDLVIEAAIEALKRYGLGAASSPVVSGTYQIHKELEMALVRFFGLKDKAVSLFSSGYGANLGTIQAFMKPGGKILVDKSVHMSILEGARLSGAEILYFEHNDVADLESLLSEHADDWTRLLVCIEGVYSADGDFGKLSELVKVAKKYSAYVLVDEAHSALVAGDNGRGVCEQEGVLEAIDLYIMTFSKAFGGVGGALLADKSIVEYVNWYAKCRMFSCALDPAVTGGLVKVVELAGGDEGNRRRQRLKENAAYFRSLISEHVNIGDSESWLIPVRYGLDTKTIDLNNYLQVHGLDSSVMQFPAVPKNEGRIRLFVTSEHTGEHVEKAAAIVCSAAEAFDFRR